MKSRELTTQEVQEKFLRTVWGQIAYWNNENRAETSLDKLEGLAHSMLSLIDGSVGFMPSFILAPMPHKDDKPYRSENGENYFPENETKSVKSDIGGNLAYQLFRVKEKMDKESKTK